MVDARHSKQTPTSGIHVAHAYEFANSATRMAYAFTSEDIGKIVRQTDTNEFFFLLTTGPTFTGSVGTGGAPSGSAGGDLSGTYPNPTVTDLTIASESQGSILYYNGSNWVRLAPSIDGYVLTTHSTGQNPTWAIAAGSGGTPSGAAGGDLTGTYPNPTVRDLTISGEVEGSILYFDGSNWIQLSPGSDGYVLTTHSIGEIPTWSATATTVSLTSSAPADVTTTAAVVGVATTAARADHKHDISTAVVGGISIGDAAAEGSSSSIARADHTHSLTAPSAPVNVTKAAASAGSSANVAREDHKHDITTATGVSTGASNAEGSSSSLARADHTHAVTDLNITGQSQGAVLYFNGTNWIRLAPSTDGYVLTTHSTGQNPTWENITSGASIPIGAAGGDLSGSYPNPTVADLTIASEVQGSILYYNGSNWVQLSPGQDGYFLTTHSTGQNPTWSIGSTSSLSLTNSAPSDVDTAAAAVGVAITAARADHKHDISTAIVGTIAVGDAAAEGSSASVARADHTHAVTAPGAPVNVTKAAASAGVATTVARSDHKHDITTATGVSTGATNAEGVSTSLARADHTHAVTDLAITSQAQGSVLYFNGTNWVHLAPSTDGYVLTTHSTGQNPTWTQVASGGGGAPSGAAGGDLSGSYPNPTVVDLTISGETQGSVLYFNGTNWIRLSPGSDGYVLTTHGTGQNPTWEEYFAANTHSLAQPDWFINASSGNDSNSGVTSGTALKTFGEWFNRIGTGRATVPMTVNVLTDLNESEYVIRGSFPLGVIIQGQRTTLYSGTVASAIAWDQTTSPVTAGSITDSGLSGTWSNSGPGSTSLIGKMIVMTSGANSGKTGWLLADLGSKTARISSLIDTFTFETGNPGASDTFIVVSQTTITNGCILVQSQPDTAGFGYVDFEDFHFNQTDSFSTSGGVIFLGNSKISGTSTYSDCDFGGVGALFNGSSTQFIDCENAFMLCCAAFSEITLSYGTVMRFDGINVSQRTNSAQLLKILQGAIVTIAEDSSFGGIGTGTTATDTIVKVASGGQLSVKSNGKLWGLNITDGFGVWLDALGTAFWPYGNTALQHYDFSGTGLIHFQVGGVDYTTFALGHYGKINASNNAAAIPQFLNPVDGNLNVPLIAAGGDLDGYYPNPTVRDLTITSETQGSILYFNGSNWVRLAPSTDGYFLTTHSTGQNPTWTGVSAGISLTSSAPADVDTSAAVIGVATTAARADHKHDISTAAPGAIAIGDSSTEGSATSVARSDHTHTLTAPAAPANVTKAAASAGAATTVARSDHKHDITTATGVSVGAANAEGSSSSLARADHTHAVTDLTITSQAQGDVLYFNGTNWVRLAPNDDGYVLTTHSTGQNPTWTFKPSFSNAVPSDVDTSIGTAGGSNLVSRADHKHDISTAAPGIIAVGDAATEGSALSLARSDHTHTLTAPAAPVNVTKAAASAGAATTVARSDHKHDITTAATGAISVGDAAAEGSASSLARSDHVHSLASPAAPANVTKAAASAGSSANVAREDHKHDITTAAASSIGATNAEGSASSLARSDHTHAVSDLAITSQVQGSVLYFNGSNWVQLSPGSDGYFLTTHSTGQNPTWSASSGGSGGAPSGAAGGDLGSTYPNPTVVDLTITSEAQGSVLYYNGSNWVQLSPSSDGYILTTHSTSQNPTWNLLSPRKLYSTLDAFDCHLDNVRTLTFNSEIDDGNSSTADTIDWTVGQKHKSTMTGNCTYTFVAPIGPCNLTLKLVQDGTGTRLATWPSAVKWPNAVAVSLSTVAASTDIISFYFDGTNYYGVGSFSFG